MSFDAVGVVATDQTTAGRNEPAAGVAGSSASSVGGIEAAGAMGAKRKLSVADASNTILECIAKRTAKSVAKAARQAALDVKREESEQEDERQEAGGKAKKQRGGQTKQATTKGRGKGGGSCKKAGRGKGAHRQGSGKCRDKTLKRHDTKEEIDDDNANVTSEKQQGTGARAVGVSDCSQAPFYGIEHTRFQVMCRTGLKGPGQSHKIPFNGNQANAIRLANEWVRNEWKKRGMPVKEKYID